MNSAKHFLIEIHIIIKYTHLKLNIAFKPFFPCLASFHYILMQKGETIVISKHSTALIYQRYILTLGDVIDQTENIKN